MQSNNIKVNRVKIKENYKGIKFHRDKIKYGKLVNQFIESNIHETILKLQVEKIEHKFLKGWALNKYVWAEGNRQISDVDILINSSDIKKTDKIFRDTGFKNTRGWIPKEISNGTNYVKHINGFDIVIDTHHKISDHQYINNIFKQEKLLENKVDQDNLIFYVIHNVIHTQYEIYTKKRIKEVWIKDFIMLNRMMKEKEIIYFLKILEKYGFISTIIQYLNVIDGQEKIKKTIFEIIKSMRINDNFMYKNEGSIMIYFRKVYYSRNKLNYIKETLFPNEAELIWKSGKKPTKMDFLKRAIKGLSK